MDIRILKRPLCELLSRSSHCVFTGNAVSLRHESTFQRTKKILNVKPDASFLFSKSSPQQDHIIFNPPSSAPSVLHTPLKFLPKEDKRRQLMANSTLSTLATSNLPLPPLALKPHPHKRHHLSEEDVEKMRQLQASDPEKWTRHKLAREFTCSAHFVSQCCPGSKEHAEAVRARLEAVKARWGPRRRMAREDRAKRREAMYRNE